MIANYESLDRLNWSRLKLIDRSPLHYKANVAVESDSLDKGTAAHAAILEPEKFEKYWVVYPGKVRNGKAWEEFRDQANAEGKSVISRSEMDAAKAMRDAVKKHTRASELLYGTPGASEIPLVWDIAGDGFKFECKGRVDRLSFTHDALVDLKTTKSAEPKAFARSVLSLGYLGQIAWYFDGYARQRKPSDPVLREAYIVAVESSAPWIVEPYRITPEQLDEGRAFYSRLLGVLDYCQKANVWTGYTGAPETDLVLPSYYRGEE